MQLDTLRIVNSPPEASLGPRSVWRYWRKDVLVDHRSYYGIIEFLLLLAFVCNLDYSQILVLGGEEGLRWRIWMGESAILVLGIIPLHWYGNQLRSSNFFTKLGTHLTILFCLAISLTVCQTLTTLSLFFASCRLRPFCHDDYGQVVLVIYWLCLFCVVAAFIVVYYGPERKRQRDQTANMGIPLPEPVKSDNSWWIWTLANVADGISDDYHPNETGGIRLWDDELDSEGDAGDNDRRRRDLESGEGTLRL